MSRKDYWGTPSLFVSIIIGVTCGVVFYILHIQEGLWWGKLWFITLTRCSLSWRLSMGIEKTKCREWSLFVIHSCFLIILSVDGIEFHWELWLLWLFLFNIWQQHFKIIDWVNNSFLFKKKTIGRNIQDFICINLNELLWIWRETLRNYVGLSFVSWSILLITLEISSASWISFWYVMFVLYFFIAHLPIILFSIFLARHHIEEECIHTWVSPLWCHVFLLLFLYCLHCSSRMKHWSRALLLTTCCACTVEVHFIFKFLLYLVHSHINIILDKPLVTVTWSLGTVLTTILIHLILVYWRRLHLHLVVSKLLLRELVLIWHHLIFEILDLINHMLLIAFFLFDPRLLLHRIHAHLSHASKES